MPREPKLDDTVPGAPPDSTETRADRLVALLRQGAYLETAALACGIGASTLHRWLNDTRPRYREFREQVDRARAEAEVNLLLQVQLGARGGQSRSKQTVIMVNGKPEVVSTVSEEDGDWRAAAWILERSFPTRYGRRQAVEVSGPGGGAVEVSDPEARRLAASLERFVVERGSVPRELDPPPGRVVDGEVDRGDDG